MQISEKETNSVESRTKRRVAEVEEYQRGVQYNIFERSGQIVWNRNSPPRSMWSLVCGLYRYLHRKRRKFFGICRSFYKLLKD